MMNMWIVTIDRPYYPSVTYFDSQNEAMEFFNDAVEVEDMEGGQYEVKVSIAMVTTHAKIRTHY